jgi:hypothetical protein
MPALALDVALDALMIGSAFILSKRYHVRYDRVVHTTSLILFANSLANHPHPNNAVPRELRVALGWIVKAYIGILGGITAAALL